MMISLFNELDNPYTSLISEYVIPPAMNTMSLFLFDTAVAARGGPLCQFAFALRREVVGGGAATLGEADATARGESLT